MLDDFTYRGVSAREQRGEDVVPKTALPYKPDNIISQGRSKEPQLFCFRGETYDTWAKNSHWKANFPKGMERLGKANRIHVAENSVQYVRYHTDFDVAVHGNIWSDTGSGNFTDDKMYVVQTNTKIIERCILIATNPGDLVLDPTCGSGTTAYVAEQWGRRWITIDTSRVALALARARIMGARYPYYLLADTREGQRKEAEITHTLPSSQPTRGNIRHGFVYERVPHVTLKSIANNAEIDVIWDKWQALLEPLRDTLNTALGRAGSARQDSNDDRNPSGGQSPPYEALGRAGQDPPSVIPGDRRVTTRPTEWQEWQIPREADAQWPDAARKAHADWWQARIARQKEIDASIAAKAEFEYLYDKPYDDKKKVRVAGPFTVESLSPHRVLGVDENDDLIDPNTHLCAESGTGYKQTFPQMILDNLKAAGVQQAHKEDRITFTSLTAWPGNLVCAEGRYLENRPSPQPSPRERGEGEDSESHPATCRRPNQAIPAHQVGEGERQQITGHTSAKDLAAVSPSEKELAEGITEKRAAIFIGPEFGTVQRADLAAAAREASECGFDVLIACAFNYEAHATEFSKLGRIPVLKARMNADLHMAEDLKNTGKGNLFVIFGEPDIDVLEAEDGNVRVKVNGVDVFHPNTGEVRSDGPDGIACWFIDTDYNEESFFVRHAYFLGANDPYTALKNTLKAEINEAAWATLHSDTSRAFAKPRSGRIAVKVINHLGDEVMKVFRVL